MSSPLFICIPAYKETEITKTISSLAQCELPNVEVKVWIFINGSESDEAPIKQVNESSYQATQKWISNYEGKLSFEVFKDLNVPSKRAGVGNARKVLGDKAYEIGQGKGVLVYLDADCTVAGNYFLAIEAFFNQTKFEAACIHFEHQIIEPQAQKAIVAYELHLRYYIAMQDWLGLPFAFHTVGSSMAVRLDAYQKRGGMNRKKAGEDFYFLQKYCKAQTIGKITRTTVYPSSRTSDRVPFGTGRAMQALENDSNEWLTYNPESFEVLEVFLKDVLNENDHLIAMENYHEGLMAFLESIAGFEKIQKIRANSSSQVVFEKNFFQFFDAFQLMKYLHFMRDEYNLLDVDLVTASSWYAENVLKQKPFTDNWEALKVLRKKDQNLM